MLRMRGGAVVTLMGLLWPGSAVDDRGRLPCLVLHGSVADRRVWRHGLEGYVRLGFRKEMEAIADPYERETYYRNKVGELYANGKAVSIASVFEIDNVIDPAETRWWIMAGLRSVPKPPARTEKKRPCIDAW